MSKTSNPASPFQTHFPKSALIPLDFFLPSGEMGRVCVLSLSADLCGMPARSRWSVPSLSVSAVQTNTYTRPVVTTAQHITHNAMVSQTSNKLRIMGRKKKQGSCSVGDQSSKNVMNNRKFKRNKAQKLQRIPWTTGISIMGQDCRWLLVWTEEQLDWVYFRSGTMEQIHMLTCKLTQWK